MKIESSDNRASKLVGLLFVVAIHGGLVYLAMSYKLIPPPQEALSLMVNLINPPKKEEPPPPEPPKPVPPKEVKLVKETPVIQPKPQPVLVAQAPVVAPSEPVAAPPPEPIKEATPAPPVAQSSEAESAEPVRLNGDELACPEKAKPVIPEISRRRNEHGAVKYKVEIDETGRITAVKVMDSSGYPRLDSEGMAKIKTWRCNPPTRNGKPARAVATQTIDFILE